MSELTSLDNGKYKNMKYSLIIIITFSLVFFSCKQSKNTQINNSELRSGFEKDYYTNGVLKSKIHYVEGVREGTYFFYHDNGKISLEGNIKEGELDGTITKYSRYGLMIQESVYCEGKLLKETHYHTNGKKRAMLDYIDSLYFSYDTLENVIRSKRIRR